VPIDKDASAFAPADKCNVARATGVPKNSAEGPFRSPAEPPIAKGLETLLVVVQINANASARQELDFTII
jgi:hypothetical protein